MYLGFKPLLVLLGCTWSLSIIDQPFKKTCARISSLGPSTKFPATRRCCGWCVRWWRLIYPSLGPVPGSKECCCFYVFFFFLGGCCFFVVWECFVCLLILFGVFCLFEFCLLALFGGFVVFCCLEYIFRCLEDLLLFFVVCGICGFVFLCCLLVCGDGAQIEDRETTKAREKWKKTKLTTQKSNKANDWPTHQPNKQTNKHIKFKKKKTIFTNTCWHWKTFLWPANIFFVLSVLSIGQSVSCCSMFVREIPRAAGF